MYTDTQHQKCYSMRILHVQRKEKLQYSPNFDRLILENWPCFSIHGCNTQNGTLFQQDSNWSLVSDANQDRVSAELNIVALFQTRIWHMFHIEAISGHGHDLHMVSDSN
jgi:hypothetical protein